MVELGEFSRLVSSVHASAVIPDHWGYAMATVGMAFGATGGALVLADATGAARIVKNANIPADALQSYSTYYHQVDYVLDAVESGPVGLVHDGRSLIALNPRSEFNHDWMRKHDMHDGLFVRLTDGPTPTCFVIPAASGDEPFANFERIKLANALVPHIQQALRTECYLTDLKRAADEVAYAVDAMRHAVFVVGPNAAVIHQNAAAEVVAARGDGIYIRNGVLVTLSCQVDGQLLRGVAAALGRAEDDDRRGSSMLCPKSSAGRGYVVHVVPFTSRNRPSERALVVVVDLDRHPIPPKQLLHRLFGLTNAEYEVARRIASGVGLGPIANELSLSLATVKSHLQHVFAKTDTHRQAELVRLMSAIAL